MSLELRQVCQQVGRDTHLTDVSLELAPGSFNVLLGPAHAGKTSILRLVAGLDRPSSGSIHLHGNDITALDVRNRDIAFVYQEFVNYPTLSVFENIASPLRVRAESKGHVARVIGEIAQLLGIGNILDRFPPSLSGGQQQRVAIARALAKDAEIVLLDEPLANLDYKLREELRRELPRLFEGTKKIVLYAATDPNEAFLLGGNTIVLHEGAVSQVGRTNEIFTSPENLVAAQTLSEFPLNVTPASFSGEMGDFNERLPFRLPAHMRSLPSGNYTLGFRAEHFSLEATAHAAISCDVVVTVTEITGNETIIHFVLAGIPCVAVVGGARELECGRTIRLFLNLSQLFVFDRFERTVASPDQQA